MSAKLLSCVTAVIQKHQNGRSYYYGSIPASEIKHVTIVPVNELSKKTYLYEEVTNGYQRPGSLTRMNLFAKYLNLSKPFLVPPVLLSGRGSWKFIEDEALDNVGKIEIYGRAAIIDGQHRCGGYVANFEKNDEDYLVDFILVDTLNLNDEIELFTTVNNNQKSVSKSLTALLEKDSNSATRVAISMNEDHGSPFHGKFAINAMTPDKLFNLASISSAIATLFSSGAYDNWTDDMKTDVLIRYWTMISDIFSVEFEDINKPKKEREFKLLELTGFLAFSKIFPEIMARSLNGGLIDWNKVQNELTVLSTLDLKKDGLYNYATGTVGAQAILRDMQRLLANQENTSEE